MADSRCLLVFVFFSSLILEVLVVFLLCGVESHVAYEGVVAAFPPYTISVLHIATIYHFPWPNHWRWFLVPHSTQVKAPNRSAAHWAHAITS